MKKVVPFLAILTFLGCKEDVVKQPKHLIEKSKMVNIMYDLALLEAIKYQNPAVLDSNQIHPKKFIYKKIINIGDYRLELGNETSPELLKSVLKVIHHV